MNQCKVGFFDVSACVLLINSGDIVDKEDVHEVFSQSIITILSQHTALVIFIL